MILLEQGVYIPNSLIRVPHGRFRNSLELSFLHACTDITCKVGINGRLNGWWQWFVNVWKIAACFVNVFQTLYDCKWCLTGLHFPSLMSAIGQHCVVKERTLVFSVIAAGGAGGTLFTGLFGSIILEKYGWQTVFHFLGSFLFQGFHQTSGLLNPPLDIWCSSSLSCIQMLSCC